MDVVIIDDMRTNLVMLEAYLKEVPDLAITAFTDPTEALTHCLENKPDIILVDQEMPGLDGITFIKRLRKQLSVEEVLLAMITGADKPDLLREALDSGANDFLHKPLDKLELLARVRNLVTLRKAHIDLARANSELELLATEDSLTGAWNRRYFLENAEMEFLRAKRFGTPLSVVMIDADHFKTVNDTYGHAGGDEVLKALADICKMDLRQIDLVGRLGGEEFAICLPDTNLEGATTVAERARKEVEGKVIPFDDKELKVTVSMGIAELTPEDTSFAALLNRSDLALYKAKEGGRNQVAYG